MARRFLLSLLLINFASALSQSACCWYDGGHCEHGSKIQETISILYEELGHSNCFTVLSAAMCAPCSPFALDNMGSVTVCESTCLDLYSNCAGLFDAPNGTVGEFCAGVFKRINFTLQVDFVENSTDCFALVDLTVVKDAQCTVLFPGVNTTGTTTGTTTGNNTTGSDEPRKKRIPAGSIILSVIGATCAIGAWFLYLKKAPGLKFEQCFLWRNCLHNEEEDAEGTNSFELQNDDISSDDNSSTSPV